MGALEERVPPVTTVTDDFKKISIHKRVKIKKILTQIVASLLPHELSGTGILCRKSLGLCAWRDNLPTV